VKWTVELSKPASKELGRLDPTVRAKIVRGVHRFATEGHGDIETIKPFSGEYRLRVGEWRVRFALDYARGDMVVLHVLNRRDAYRD
jgi:mRNA interferase RelE/StbE